MASWHPDSTRWGESALDATTQPRIKFSQRLEAIVCWAELCRPPPIFVLRLAILFHEQMSAHSSAQTRAVCNHLVVVRAGSPVCLNRVVKRVTAARCFTDE